MVGEASWVVELGGAPRSMVEAEYWKAKAEHWKERCMYKVPAYVTDMNPKAYLPWLVLFGPYHHDKEHLKPMEEHKDCALVDFINRSEKPFMLFVEAMSEVLDDLMACYDPLDQKWRDDRDSFLQLMILDGCFMLEILRTWATQVVDEYPPNDPIFGNHGKIYIMPYVRMDMLMLQNQLPMLVLDTLVAAESDGSKDKEFVNKLILKFCFLLIPAMEMRKCPRAGCLPERPDHERGSSNNIKKRSNSVIDKFDEFHVATELDEAGIQFSKSTSASLEDVSFRSEVLRLSVIFVGEATKSMFLNLFPFEQSQAGAGSEVRITSYDQRLFRWCMIMIIKHTSSLLKDIPLPVPTDLCF